MGERALGLNVAFITYQSRKLGKVALVSLSLQGDLIPVLLNCPEVERALLWEHFVNHIIIISYTEFYSTLELLVWISSSYQMKILVEAFLCLSIPRCLVQVLGKCWLYETESFPRDPSHFQALLLSVVTHTEVTVHCLSSHAVASPLTQFALTHALCRTLTSPDVTELALGLTSSKPNTAPTFARMPWRWVLWRWWWKASSKLYCSCSTFLFSWSPGRSEGGDRTTARTRKNIDVKFHQKVYHFGHLCWIEVFLVEVCVCVCAYACACWFDNDKLWDLGLGLLCKRETGERWKW